MSPETDVQRRLREGIEHHKAGRAGDAEHLYRQVVQSDPKCAQAWYLLSALAEQAGQPLAALEHVDRALALDPDDERFHYSRGIALQRQQRNEEAAVAYERVLQRQPEHRQALENLAVALADSGDDHRAEAACRRALAVAPESAIAHRNLATILIGRGRREAALDHLDRLLASNPADASAHAKRAQVRLAMGDFGAGYEDYAWRRHSPDFGAENRPVPLPIASLGGADPTGHKLAVLPEQGVGDEILFAAGIPALRRKAESILLFADPRLVPLFARSFPGVDVRAASRAGIRRFPAGVDGGWRRVEAGDVPRLGFGDDWPLPCAYLRPDENRVRFWRQRLDEEPGRKIGLAWHGGADARARRARSLAAEDLAPLLERSDCRFVNLQYPVPGRDSAAELRAVGVDTVELGDLDTKNDLDELAALCVALDTVVTVDSAIAHLAAAVGARVFVLLPAGGDWRWFHERNDSPWYPDVRVWRRVDGEGWRSVVERAVAGLGEARPAAERLTATDSDGETGEIANPAPGTLLLNDTSAWYHWGCSCTSIALQEGLRAGSAAVDACSIRDGLLPDTLSLSPAVFDSAALYKRFRRALPWLVDAIQAADRVVINGEGTLHGLGSQAIGLLYVAWIAMRRLDRPVEIVNHSVYPLDASTRDERAAVDLYRNVYSGLQRVVVREPGSAEVLRALGVDPIEGFDCLPLFAAQHGPAVRDPGQRNGCVVIAGSVALTERRIATLAGIAADLREAGYRTVLLLGAVGDPAADDARFAEALFAGAAAKPEVLLARSEYEWLDCIGASALLISGRFHHSIAAACLRTPFVALGSNTPKIAGLAHTLGRVSGKPEGFAVTGDDDAAVSAAVRARLEEPTDFVAGDAQIAELRDLAMRNF